MLSQKIEEILFNRKHTIVRIKLKSNIEKEIAEELELEKITKGSEFSIPWWKAKILLDEDLIELLDDNRIDETYIQKRIWSEKSKTQLDELDKTFYIKIGYQLNKLKEENKQNPNPVIIQKIENIEIPINDLLSTRITKILKMAFRRASPQALEKLTAEEKWLYENVNQIIELWVNKILGD